MSAKKFTKVSREWQMFVDYWNLCQKYWITEDGDEYWKNVVNGAISFGEEYKDIPISSKLSIALLEYLKEQHEKKISST